MFSNKKILLVCKETYSWPMILMAEKLCKDNSVALFFGAPAECTFNEFELGYKSTYYYAKKNDDKWKVFDVRDITIEFLDNVKTAKVNYDYLDYLEKNYTHYKNINLQCMSAQELSRFSHYRTIYGYPTFEQRFYWLELNYKRIIKIIDEFSPDVVLDINNETIQRAILSEVCYKEDIPHINVEEAKVDDWYFYSFSNTSQLDEYFMDGYRNALLMSKFDLANEYEYIEEYRKQTCIMAERLKDTINAQYDADSWRKIFRWFLSAAHYEFQKDYLAGNRKLCKKSPFFFGEARKQLWYYTKAQIKRKYLCGKNRYFEDPVPGEKYVYVPLHLIPESTTCVQAPLYVNELSNIEMLAKSIPAGWKVYVKEHPAMLGERDFEFYEKVKKIPNVRLVQFNYYNDPKPWIMNSEGVYTITGSSAFEAALLGKRSIILGEMSCQVIEGICKLDSFRNLAKEITKFKEPIDNIHSCAAFIYTAKKYGVEFKVFTLMSRGKLILKDGHKMDKQYSNELDELINFFYRGYELYYDRKHKQK